MAFAADNDVGVALFSQPGNILCRGNAGIHDDGRCSAQLQLLPIVALLMPGIRRRTQAVDHLPQGTRLADITREDPAAPGKTAAIQHQR